ncbi:MAG: ACT domain-containing protein [Clostridia bacterium]|nr:ACT domain-containing protein [Clostridia bacterium]
MKAIVTVTGKDRIGILAEVTKFISEMKCNVEDISQTIMQGTFVMIMMVSTETSPYSFKEIQEKASELGKKTNLSIAVQRNEIFDEMHRV